MGTYRTQSTSLCRRYHLQLGKAALSRSPISKRISKFAPATGATDKITDIFALQLFEDPSFEIEYDDHKIDAREAIRGVEEKEIQITSENGAVIEARLEIVEWNKRIDRKLMLCLPGRFSFHEMPAGIQARGFWFTGISDIRIFPNFGCDDNTEGLVELDVLANQLLEETKVKLREHFREKRVRTIKVKNRRMEKG